MAIKMTREGGWNSACIEGHNYAPDDDGNLVVADEAHLPTLTLHGFVRVEETAEAPARKDPFDHDGDGKPGGSKKKDKKAKKDPYADLDDETIDAWERDDLETFLNHREVEFEGGARLKQLRRLAKRQIEE